MSDAPDDMPDHETENGEDAEPVEEDEESGDTET